MRYGLLLATAATLAIGTTQATACSREELAVINSYYQRYLYRQADRGGLDHWAHKLDCGQTLQDVRCGILASAEYYHLHGCSPEGFVAGLYADVLGREAHPREIADWVCRLGRCNDRQALSQSFLIGAERELAERYAPTIAPPSYPVPASPSYYAPPSYTPSRGQVPVQPYIPQSGVSLRVRVGR